MASVPTQPRSSYGFGSFILLLLAILGIVLAVYRFGTGLASVTNLNQGYPWGFWIGFDVLAGIALAAGGFVVAGLVHVFGGEKYHSMVRPAIVTAFLGYLLFIAALLIDLGRPWAIWHMLIYQQHHSPMFEVGFCVMFYTTVLFIEFLPIAFQRFGWKGATDAWQSWAPWAAIALLVLFAMALTRSTPWVLVIAAALVIFQLLVMAGVLKRDPRVPTILIMAGIIFSTLHQSSLGTLFLMVPHKLSPIWYSNLLPVMFFISAIMAGLAMVIVESSFAGWAFRHKPKLELIQGMGKGLSWAILVYLALRIVDLVANGAGTQVITVSWYSLAFWVEIGVGLLIPLAILLTPDYAASRTGLLWAGIFTVAGVIIHRLNVAVTGISAPLAERYYPAWSEVAITLGVVSVGILLYMWICNNFPVFEDEKHAEAA